MLKFIDEILLCFRPYFSRLTAFEWFATIITGLMIRSDSLGITSIIRDLVPAPSLYNCMEHFFHADSWDWYDIFAGWTKTVSRYAPLKHISGRTVLIGDGVKRASDGRYMPCIKKMVQESESASKPTFIHGHFFGAVGVLAGKASKSFQEELTITKIISSRQVSFENEEIDLLIS